MGESLGGGRYVITEHLGGTPDRGRYRARDESTKDTVLVTLGTTQTARAAVLRERLALEVAGVAPLLEISDLKAGYTGLVENEPSGAPALTPLLDVGSAARLALEIAVILRRAHAQGLTLAGLRPELVYVDDDRVTGIAPRCEPFLVTAGEPCYGVPPCFDHFYLAPELLTAPSEPTGPAADVFSLCAILGHWVAGEHPFAGEGISQGIAIMTGNRRPWHGDPAVGALIDGGLEPDPGRRLRLAEVVERLDPLARRNPESAPIAWERTGDGEFPYRARWRGETVTIRVNDFPAEPLYTLMSGDTEIEDLEDWPPRWIRPPFNIEL